MSDQKPSVPRVYASISAITAELATGGIPKSRVNEAEGYRFRGIDDVMQALAPLLARHRLCFLPRVLERTSEERQGANRTRLTHVCLKVAFDLVSVRDGSVHTLEVHGEALDGSDKATAKAMSAACKQAMLHAFCIPAGDDDADAHSHRLEALVAPQGEPQADPVQGWEQWSRDIGGRISSCHSKEALACVQDTYRDQLRRLSRTRPDLFAAVGNAIADKRSALARPEPSRGRSIGPGAKDEHGSDAMQGGLALTPVVLSAAASGQNTQLRRGAAPDHAPHEEAARGTYQIPRADTEDTLARDPRLPGKVHKSPGNQSPRVNGKAAPGHG